MEGSRRMKHQATGGFHINPEAIYKMAGLRMMVSNAKLTDEDINESRYLVYDNFSYCFNANGNMTLVVNEIHAFGRDTDLFK